MVLAQAVGIFALVRLTFEDVNPACLLEMMPVLLKTLSP